MKGIVLKSLLRGKQTIALPMSYEVEIVGDKNNNDIEVTTVSKNETEKET